jgi:anti-sigma factor (TIGR02949 family)
MNDEIMIPCDHVIARLWEYLDGDLDELRSEQVRRHLDACARCFPEYDFRRAYLKFMRRCSTRRVPPELRRRIFEAILERERRAEAGEGGFRYTVAVDRARRILRRVFGRA